MSETIAIAGFGPLPVVRPASVAELGRVVAAARARGEAVYPVGGRTMLDVGGRPTKPGVAVDTTGLAGVVDYPARDLTITVRAGTTVAELARTLAAENQWLPVDVPRPDRATVGGAVATNASGPRRFGHGTLRDYVLGVSFMTDDGVEVSGGGRVVKNVAGYDFMKLQTGALGTLGVLTQLTLKVKPRPEAAAVLAIGCSAGELAATLDRLHASNSRPVAVELFNAAAWRTIGKPAVPGDWVLAVGFEEKRVTVDWQRQTLLAELPAAVEVGDVWQRATDLQLDAVGKASVRPSEVAAVANRVNRDGVPLHGQPLNGILWRHGPADGFAPRRERVSASGSATGLMKHVKRTLDPDGVFNPGRLW